MKNEQFNEFLKLVDAKFAGKTPPNCPDDPRRLTVGLALLDRLVSYISHRPPCHKNRTFTCAWLTGACTDARATILLRRTCVLLAQATIRLMWSTDFLPIMHVFTGNGCHRSIRGSSGRTTYRRGTGSAAISRIPSSEGCFRILRYFFDKNTSLASLVCLIYIHTFFQTAHRRFHGPGLLVYLLYGQLAQKAIRSVAERNQNQIIQK